MAAAVPSESIMMLENDMRCTWLEDIDHTTLPDCLSEQIPTKQPFSLCTTSSSPEAWCFSAMPSTNGTTTPSSRSGLEVLDLHTPHAGQVRTTCQAPTTFDSST